MTKIDLLKQLCGKYQILMYINMFKIYKYVLL